MIQPVPGVASLQSAVIIESSQGFLTQMEAQEVYPDNLICPGSFTL